MKENKEENFKKEICIRVVNPKGGKNMREKEMKEKKEMKERNRGFLKGFVGAMIVAIAIVSAFAISPSGTSPLSGETVVSIDPLTQNVSAGETFTVDITIDPNGEPIAGAQADLLFDPSLIQAKSVSYGGIFGPEGFPPGGTAWFINGTIDNINGTIGNIVALYIGTGGITTSGVFAIIEFTAGSIGGTSPLNLTNVMVGGPSGEVPIMVNNGSVTIVLVDATPPEIIDNTPSDAYTGDPFTFNATVTDNVQVSTVWVEYWYGTGHTNGSMNNVADDYWEKTITVEDTLEILHYIISANDTSNNWNQTIQEDVTVTDNDDPSLDANNSDTSGTTGDVFHFNITASDNIEVDSVNASWSHGSLSGDLALTETAGHWLGEITLDLYSLDDLNYRIQVNDTSDNFVLGPEKIVGVTDNDDPTLDADNSDTSGTTGDVFHFNITASDNIEVGSVNASWSHGSLSGNLALTETAGYWTGTIILDDSLDDLTYQIQVNDTSGNYVLGPKKTVTVTDNDLPTITDVTATSDFLSSSCLWKVNISAVVTDNVQVDEVYVNISYPDGSYENFSITQNDDTYYCNKSYGAVGSKAGTCEYYIWANDTHGNQNTSSIHQFVIPPDWDINSDGNVNVLELIIVGGHWEETGALGWIRADVNRDGMISVLDLILIGQYWTG